MIEDCSLSNLDLLGYTFSWDHGAGIAEWIEVRLDRVLVSCNFMNLFPESKLFNLEVSTSDHCPILLKMKKMHIAIQVKRFSFKNAWLREPMCQQIVEEVWSSGTSHSFYDKLQELSEIYPVGA